MSDLLWFNPHNDLALAAGVSHYTPPANAARLAWAGRLLPLWYSQPGDFILAAQPDDGWIESVANDFGIEADVYRGQQVARCRPWGWSVDARSRFVDAGIDAGSLPDDDDLQLMASLSHRRLTVALMTQLSRRLPFGLPPMPVEASSVADVLAAVARFGGKAFVKLPYSSTGRGVVNISGMSTSDIAKRVEAMLRRQQSVMVERALDKTLDFAMLFKAHSSRVEFVGYSAFMADNGVAYSGNLVMSDEKIKNDYLGRYLPVDILDCLESTMPPVLSTLIGNSYDGYFGVDMMVYRLDDGNGYAVAPAVEVNLRMTMGVVAHHLRQRVVAPDVDALMRIGFRESIDCSSKVIESGRLVSGTMSLTPPESFFSFSLSVI